MSSHSIRMRTVLTTCAALALSVTACKKETPAEPTGPGATPSEEADAVAVPAEPSPVVAPVPVSPSAAEPQRIPLAQDVLKPGVRFQFALRDSPDVLRNTTDQCAAEAHGDAGKQAACIQAIETQGEREGIRFEREGERLVWVSYGQTPAGAEEVFLRGPIELLPGAPGELRFQPAGPFTGLQAKGMGIDTFDATRAGQHVMTVQVIDDHTVAMPAPAPKGRLVYHRKG